MSQNYPQFIQSLERTDPRFATEVTAVYDLALAPGELDPRTKILIALALDCLAGAKTGVKTLAAIARSMGASDGQIAETLRLAYLVAGNQVLETAQTAFEE